MSMPHGRRLELLSPFDPQQEPGTRPRVYPFHLMQPGDWFQVEICTPNRAAAIRSAVANYRKKNRDKRFSVYRPYELGPSAIVCTRVS